MGHMDGLNALPKWDRSNPKTYSYDPATYSAADYADFKQARLDAQAKQEKQTAALSKKISKDNQKALDDFVKDQKQKLSDKEGGVDRDQIEQWAKSGKRMYADVASDCFAELSWKADPDDPTTGTAHAEFVKRNPDGGYDYEDIDLDTWLAWCSDSLGEFFNAAIRE